MNNQERSSLGSAVRASHGYCLDMADVLTRWLKDNPQVVIEKARSLASMAHGVPFPSIRGRKEGPFPVYPERPYFDARFHEGSERGTIVVNPCGHEVSA